MTPTTTLKLASYPLAIIITEYLGIGYEQMSILAVLLVADVITGVFREYVVNPHNISSRIGIIGVLSKLLTFTIPFIIALITKGSGIDMTSVIKGAITILVIYEGWSVISNIGQIRAKDKTIPEYDAISFLLKKLQDTLKAMLTTIMQK